MSSPIVQFPPYYMALHGARLIDNGYPILPICPRLKKPGRYQNGQWSDYPDWTKHCSRSTKQYELDIWELYPSSGVGIACGTIAAVDIDIKDAGIALRLDELAREMLGNTPALRIGQAPKRLLVYRTTEHFPSMRRAPLEILCHGRQFVAYGIHPDTGKPYEWINDSLVDIRLESLPEINQVQATAYLDAAWELIPDGFRESNILIGPSRSTVDLDNLEGTYEAIEDALSCIHNNDLPYDDWVSICLAVKGALKENGWQLFRDWSSTSKKDNPQETEKKWRKCGNPRSGAGTIYHIAFKYGWNPPHWMILNARVAAAAAAVPHPAAGLIAKAQAQVESAETHEENKEDQEQEQQPETNPRSVAIANLLGHLDGGLKLMVDWINTTAISPQPFLALGASLACFGTLAGRNYESPTRLRTNVYIVGIADSGGGKENARKRIKESLYKANLTNYIGGEKLVSGPGLITALQKNVSRIFQIDEFGKWLQIVLSKKAPPHLAEVWNYLTELYTSSDAVFNGPEYADQRTRPRAEINGPCCCIHATTVPKPFWDALSGGNVNDGSLARFSVFQTDNDYPERNINPSRDGPPKKLLDIMQDIAIGIPLKGNLASIQSEAIRIGSNCANSSEIKVEPYTVPFDAEALSMWGNDEREITARFRENQKNGTNAILNRKNEQTIKFSVIKAVSRNPAAPVVTGADYEWSRSLVAICMGHMLVEVEDNIADNETEREVKRVLNAIKKAGKNGITGKLLLNKTRWLQQRRRMEILQDLISEEKITATEEKLGARGPAAFVYREKI